MAAVGGITIDGYGTGRQYKSALALNLTHSASLNKVEQIEDWNIELQKDTSYLVVRNESVLDRDTLLREGYEHAERFLDLLSFEHSLTLEIAASGREHILLFEREGKSVLEQTSTSNQGFSLSFSVAQQDENGEIISPPPTPPAQWLPALRFYRLSQASRNPYDAYRNLWLGLEALLSAEFPKGNKEKEGVWLRRSLGQICARVNLTPVLPANTNVVDHIMSRHYSAMRCNLFHAKIPATQLVPQLPTVEQSLDAYGELVRIWRLIAGTIGELHSNGSGIITNIGFEKIMAALFSQIDFFVTDDDTLPQATDVRISPNDCTITCFDSSRHVGVVAPGSVENLGILNVATRGILPVIHRMATCLDQELYSLGYCKEGLDINGVDEFNYRQVWRLLNNGTPRTNFD